MTITAYSAKSSVALLSTTILLLLISSSSSSSFSSNINVLKSGQRLDSGSFLSYGNYVFAMQADCNLVLYNNETALWSSHTDGMGKDCYLSLAPDGELYIYDNGVKMVWRSETGGVYGHYALVLQPNGNVVIYGSPIWSTGLSYQTPNAYQTPNPGNYEPNTIKPNNNP